MTKTPEQVARAWEMVDHIFAHPDKHDQSFWLYGEFMDFSSPVPLGLDDVMDRCGTTACAAGWVVLLAGRKINPYLKVERLPGQYESVPRVAAQLLGLTEIEADLIFAIAESAAEVRETVIGIFGPRPVPPSITTAPDFACQSEGPSW